MRNKPSSSNEDLLREYERFRIELQLYFANWRMAHVSAEDLVQQVYLRLMKEELATIEDPRKFIFYLARLVACDEIPNRDRERTIVSLDAGTSAEPFNDSVYTSPDTSLQDAESAELQRNIDALGPDLTFVVRLYHLGDLTIGEISGMTGIKPDALKKRLRKAMVILRDRYGASVLKNP